MRFVLGTQVAPTRKTRPWKLLKAAAGHFNFSHPKVPRASLELKHEIIGTTSDLACVRGLLGAGGGGCGEDAPHWNRRCALLETPPYQAKLGGDPIPRHQPPSYRSLIEAVLFCGRNFLREMRSTSK